MNTALSTCILAAMACHMTACATASGAGPSEAAASAQSGPAPATRLSTDRLELLDAILSRYRADRLDADQARALLDELHKAGLVPGPALQRALADRGFSAKQLAEIAKVPTAPDRRDTRGAVTPSGRIVPPPP